MQLICVTTLPTSSHQALISKPSAGDRRARRYMQACTNHRAGMVTAGAPSSVLAARACIQDMHVHSTHGSGEG